jgi:hypothetical protein
MIKGYLHGFAATAAIFTIGFFLLFLIHTNPNIESNTIKSNDSTLSSIQDYVVTSSTIETSETQLATQTFDSTHESITTKDTNLKQEYSEIADQQQLEENSSEIDTESPLIKSDFQNGTQFLLAKLIKNQEFIVGLVPDGVHELSQGTWYGRGIDWQAESFRYVTVDGDGLYISTNKGLSYTKFSHPELNQVKFIKLAFFPKIDQDAESKGSLIIVTESKGIFISYDNGKTIYPIVEGLPTKILVENGKPIPNLYRDIIDFSYDPSDPNHLYLNTSYGVYYTEKTDYVWKKYPEGPLDSLTCIAYQANPFHLIIGTATRGCHGQLESKGRYLNNNTGLKSHTNVLEQIESVNMDYHHPNRAYLGQSFTGYGFQAERSENILRWQVLNIPITKPAPNKFPELKPTEAVRYMGSHYWQNKLHLFAVTTQGVFYKEFSNTDQDKSTVWHPFDIKKFIGQIETNGCISGVYEQEQSKINFELSRLFDSFSNATATKDMDFQELAENKFGIYFQTHVSRSKDRMETIFEYIEKTPMNMVTIDLKDDTGYLRYPSKLEMADKVGSVYAPIDLEKFIQSMHEHNIYVVARHVVFKDRKLWDYNNGQFAIKDKRNNNPWYSHRSERWVDQFCEQVWQYNADIAAELIEFGVDEIQFDYIRFPTDGGGLENMTWPHQLAGQKPADALESFLNLVRKKVSAPISIDIYGRQGWYHLTNRLGQDIRMISHYVDVICPMFYPSHFENGFLNFDPRDERTLRIYNYGSRRSQIMVEGRSIIRPWVQAFHLNVAYDREFYSKEYIYHQIEGCDIADSLGYTFWNAGTKYEDVYDMYKYYQD